MSLLEVIRYGAGSQTSESEKLIMSLFLLSYNIDFSTIRYLIGKRKSAKSDYKFFTYRIFSLTVEIFTDFSNDFN